MWLSASVYKRIPYFWLLLGLLFMVTGSYVGFDNNVAYLYVGVGLISCFWSLCVYSLRSRAEQYTEVDLDAQDESPEPAAPAANQSTEQTG